MSKSERVTDINEPLYRKAAFGKQIEEFTASDIGRYLIKRAESEVQAAFEDLKAVNPVDGKAVQALQSRIWRAESFQQWLADGIIDGLQAFKIITDEE